MVGKMMALTQVCLHNNPQRTSSYSERSIEKVKKSPFLKKQGVTVRSANEPILHLIPARNIETWLAYLRGETVDERAIYPKLARERDCVPMVHTLKAMCDAGKLREPAPSSLVRACVEYRERLP